MELKRCRIVMLPTEKAKSGISMKIISNEGVPIGQLSYCSNKNEIDKNNPYWQSQHLYIISSEEIKEGDWFITPSKHLYLLNIDAKTWMSKAEIQASSKVIASTDDSLRLPKPSEAFIKKYIELHNEGNSIIEVDVECENNAPKVKDGEITIRKPKDSYTRKEVEQLLVNCVAELVSEKGLTPTSDQMKVWNELTKNWISNNL